MQPSLSVFFRLHPSPPLLYFKSTCKTCSWTAVSRMRLCSSARADGGCSGFLPLGWSAKKNNSKRSTILQHLLAGPHQQMLQNSSALEIKEAGGGGEAGDARDGSSVRRWRHWKRFAARKLSANGNSEKQRYSKREIARDRGKNGGCTPMF